MFCICSLLLFLQVSLFPITQAASLPLPSPNVPITLTGTTGLTLANHAGIPLTNPSNELTLFFTNPGGPIPAAELRHTLSVATARVQDYLPHHANEPITSSFFETNISFPETGDGVYTSVHAFGFGLSWVQLSHTLMILQQYMLGMGPGNPDTHYQQLDFYVQPSAGGEVAYGVVEFTPGARAVAKRNLITTTLRLPHANSSSLSTVTLPIIFNIPSTNLDLNITSLGLPIPKDVILDTIESAFTEIIQEHTDIDAPIPLRPYSFTDITGKPPHEFKTEILVASYPGKRISWGLLCILIYGLRDFMSQTEHFNSLAFEIEDAKEGIIGHGDVFYWPAGERPLAKGLGVAVG